MTSRQTHTNCFEIGKILRTLLTILNKMFVVIRTTIDNRKWKYGSQNRKYAEISTGSSNKLFAGC